MLQSLDERMDSAEADDRAKAESAEKRVQANDIEWGKVGPLGRMLNKDVEVLNAQTTVLQERYAALTRLEGLQFGKAMLVDLTARLQDLANGVAMARKTVDDATKACCQAMSTRCAQPADYDLNRLVVAFYNTDAVRRLATDLERDQDEQALQTRAVRVAIKDKVAAGEQGTFAKFNDRLRVDSLVELLERTCEKAVDVAHGNLVATAQGHERLLGVNIIDKLHDQFAGRPDDLMSFVHNLMAKAGRYGTFNQSEQSQQGKGISTGAPPAEFAVLLPTSAERKEFRDNLAELFRGSTGSMRVSVFESSRKNEITLISVAAGFPLRFLGDVRFLRDRYERRLESNERARIEVHLEGDGTQFPDLYLPKPEDVRQEMMEYLLVAEALELVQRRPRGSQGRMRLCHVVYDDDGDVRDTVDLGADVFDAAEQATTDGAYEIRKVVDDKLRSREFRSEDRRVALRKTLSERVRDMRDALDDHECDLRDQLAVALQGAKARLQPEMRS